MFIRIEAAALAMAYMLHMHGALLTRRMFLAFAIRRDHLRVLQRGEDTLGGHSCSSADVEQIATGGGKGNVEGKDTNERPIEEVAGTEQRMINEEQPRQCVSAGMLIVTVRRRRKRRSTEQACHSSAMRVCD